MAFALLLFALFTLIAVAGVFWIVRERKGTTAAGWAAIITLLAFAALLALLTLVLWPMLQQPPS